MSSLSKLRASLAEYFSLDELESLCFDLGIDKDDVPGKDKGKDYFITELLSYVQRRKLLPRLLIVSCQTRLKANWEDVISEAVQPSELITPQPQIGFIKRLSTWTILLLIGVALVIAVLLGYYAPNIWARVFPPSGDFVQFGLNSNLDKLNPVLKWQQGESKISSYKIGQRPLVITAGSWTNQYNNVSTAPMVTHLVRGDFETQVMMVFHPTDGQYAGIGVRSTGNTSTWLRVTRARNGNNDVVVFSTNDKGQFAYRDYIAYSDNIVHLRIIRRSNLFSLFYSPDGNAWTRIGSTEFDLPDEVEVYLLVLGGDIATAQFQDFKMVKN